MATQEMAHKRLLDRLGTMVYYYDYEAHALRCAVLEALNVNEEKEFVATIRMLHEGHTLIRKVPVTEIIDDPARIQSVLYNNKQNAADQLKGNSTNGKREETTETEEN